MARMKLGIQLYSLRKYLKKPENVQGVFERCRDMGAEVVQVSGMCPMDSKELARISRDSGLPVCCTHSPLGRIKNDLERLAEEHLDFNCRNIGIGMMSPEYMKSAEGIKRFIELLNTTAEKLKQYDMTIAYHNHAFEFKKRGGRLIMDMLIEDTLPEVEFIPDTCWIHAGGKDSVEIIARMSGRINTLHLKDYKRKLFMHTPMAIGEGIIDFKPIITTAGEHGVVNAVIELDSHPNPYLAMEQSLEEIRKIYSQR